MVWYLHWTVYRIILTLQGGRRWRDQFRRRLCRYGLMLRMQLVWRRHGNWWLWYYWLGHHHWGADFCVSMCGRWKENGKVWSHYTKCHNKQLTSSWHTVLLFNWKCKSFLSNWFTSKSLHKSFPCWWETDPLQPFSDHFLKSGLSISISTDILDILQDTLLQTQLCPNAFPFVCNLPQLF